MLLFLLNISHIISLSGVKFVPLFGQRLKYLREKKEETQEDIAKFLRISRAAVSKYESGDREPDIETIKALSSHFEVSVDYIFGLSDSENNFAYIKDDPSFYTVNENQGSESQIQIQPGTTDPYNLQELAQDRELLDLVLKIKENNLDIDAIDNIITNIIALKKSTL
jgi:transcriptional regulator with XRE-family HTH domain